ncbi:MAG: hypothetical protein H0V19_10890 [Euzebyales bacterium]|nr:hypothetical protein [Euzebyales bacterium]
MSRLVELQSAARAIGGVQHATVRWPEPLGPATLRVEFADGADRSAVTSEVLALLGDIAGTGVEQLRAGHDGAARDGLLRPVFNGLVEDRRELDSTVEVTLVHAGRRAVGRAEGLATNQASIRSAATATLSALRSFLPEGIRIQLDWLEVAERAGPDRPDVVLSAVTWLTRQGEETFVGSAIVGPDVREAAVRATLDALNRRLACLARV